MSCSCGASWRSMAGCLAAFFHVGAIEALGHLLYPPPTGLDFAELRGDGRIREGRSRPGPC